MSTAEKYVTGAYLVLLGSLLVYLLIIALKGRFVRTSTGGPDEAARRNAAIAFEQELADVTRAAREKLGG